MKSYIDYEKLFELETKICGKCDNMSMETKDIAYDLYQGCGSKRDPGYFWSQAERIKRKVDMLKKASKSELNILKEQNVNTVQVTYRCVLDPVDRIERTACSDMEDFNLCHMCLYCCIIDITKRISIKKVGYAKKSKKKENTSVVG